MRVFAQDGRVFESSDYEAMRVTDDFKFQIKLTSTGDWTTIAEYDSLKEAAEAFSCYKFKIGLQSQFHFPQKKSSYQPQ